MIKKYFKLERNNISLIQFIIEGHEGIATVTTIDPHAAIIRISVIPDFITEMEEIINNLKKKYDLEEINYPEPCK